MIRHAIMWRFMPLDGKTPAQIAEDVRAKYLALKKDIPELKNVEVGINRNESATAFDAILLEDFDSWQDLATYKTHPKRESLTKYLDSIVDVRARVEYEQE